MLLSIRYHFPGVTVYSRVVCPLLSYELVFIYMLFRINAGTFNGISTVQNREIGILPDIVGKDAELSYRAAVVGTAFR